jgi:hypothetical protein
VHALTVARRLADRGAEPVIVNTATFGTSALVSMAVRPEGCGFILRLGRLEISSRELAGAWLRRTPPIEVDPAVRDDEARRFCSDEHIEVLLGLAYQLPNVINAPGADRAANRKPLQLAMAREVGLRVPPTLISNDAQEIREFVATCAQGVVFKILSTTRFQFTETRVFDPRAHPALLGAARYAPTIFQARVAPQEHLRVTVVDDEIFVAAIRTTAPEALWDWRLDRDCAITEGSLAADDANRVRTLLRRLGLRYGALDLIVDDEGESWFLEVNPGGQFLFAEIHAGLPISDALARSLLRPAADPAQASPAVGQ